MSFTITDTRTASWAIRKIAAIEADSKKRIAWHKEEIEKEKAAAERGTAYLQSLLLQYYNELPPEAVKHSKTQSTVSVPGGKLVYKPRVVKYDVDKKAMANLVQSNPELALYAKVSIEADWEGLKAASQDEMAPWIDQDTGEVLGERMSRVYTDAQGNKITLPVTVTIEESFKATPDKTVQDYGNSDMDLEDAYDAMQGDDAD